MIKDKFFLLESVNDVKNTLSPIHILKMSWTKKRSHERAKSSVLVNDTLSYHDTHVPTDWGFLKRQESNGRSKDKANGHSNNTSE